MALANIKGWKRARELIPAVLYLLANKIKWDTKRMPVWIPLAPNSPIVAN